VKMQSAPGPSRSSNARPIRVGTAGDCDLGQRNEPIQMDPRRSAATGNPDP